jgi:hypothetical protein
MSTSRCHNTPRGTSGAGDADPGAWVKTFDPDCRAAVFAQAILVRSFTQNHLARH